FDANVISVCRTSLYNKSKGGIYTETPKTAQSVRSLKVPEEVMDFLRKWQGLQTKQKEQAGDLWTDNDRIFTKWNGDPLHRSAPRNYFVKFCERTGMRYVSCHSMRHINNMKTSLLKIRLKSYISPQQNRRAISKYSGFDYRY
ncbi:MAG: site-specific integrase, partial [Ruminiclostridium sp.]|nr:site-specific integrase [Ruminiclostridium sp.]